MASLAPAIHETGPFQFGDQVSYFGGHQLNLVWLSSSYSPTIGHGRSRAGGTRRSRRGGTRHSGPPARACAPYYQHTDNDGYDQGTDNDGASGGAHSSLGRQHARGARSTDAHRERCRCGARAPRELLCAHSTLGRLPALAHRWEDSAHGVRAPQKPLCARSSLGRQRARRARSTDAHRAHSSLGRQRARRARPTEATWRSCIVGEPDGGENHGRSFATHRRKSALTRSHTMGANRRSSGSRSASSKNTRLRTRCPVSCAWYLAR